MCSGPRKPISPSPTMSDDSSSVKIPPTTLSLLLELSASDDLSSFKHTVDSENHAVDASGTWYSRSVGSAAAMGFADRTPLMIAALYGSVQVLRYIIHQNSLVHVNRRSESDGVTALHLAAAGGSKNSLDAVKILIEAGADVEAADNSSRRPGDVIARLNPSSDSSVRSLEVLLRASSCARVSSPTKEDEKKTKEYPLDLTLPDIKNGIYGTDEFRMYTFKVKPCSRAYSHDWTECPFVHPGENARRRDPSKYLYSCVPCPEFRKGSCRNGDNCEYAHGVFECWLHPAQYRTRLCKDETGCNRRVCFFAHKPEELRSVNPTAASVAGLVAHSPRSSGVSNLEMAAAALMLSASSSPLSPSAVSAGMGSPSVWMNQPPALQMPSSRLKSAMSARDFDIDLELLGLEGYQQKLIDEISNAASPRSNWPAASSLSLAAASRAADYNHLFGSLEPSVRTQLANQSLTQQLLSGYGSNLPSSPTLNSSSSFGLDHSMAKAIMNSRAAAFAKRSQSFCDRGAVARQPSGLSAVPATTMGISGWGSPDGKLDWGIQGEELNKLRKSSSFGFRNNQGGFRGGSVSPPKTATVLDEPDLSWVQSLVKDGPAGAPVGRGGFDQQQKQYQRNGGGGELVGSEIFSPWGEEQMVA